MSLSQDVDAIIAEENIDNSQSATEEPQDQGDSQEANQDDQQVADDSQQDNNADDNASDDQNQDDQQDKGDDANKPDDANADDQQEDQKPEEKQVDPLVTPPSEPPKTGDQVEQAANTMLQTLQLTDDKIFDAEGNVKPFNEVVKAGDFLASQVEPVKVTDKDGVEHEFFTLEDVKEKFPDGFEAKNNIEQMQFQSQIMENQRKFTDAVNVYKNAQEQYTKETTALVEARSENDRIGQEYKAMAEQGLVPKIEGDPNDPKFLESAAVKELNNILNWMDTKNKELRDKGLGQINSVYVAKQLMTQEATTVDKQDKSKQVIDERKEVASLSATGSQAPADKGNKVHSSVPLSRLADEIIASEGLK